MNQRPKLSKGSEEQIFDTDWTICIDKNMNLIFNNEKYNKKYFIQKLSDENELIGIYYIYDWPVSKDEIFKNYTLVSDSKQ